MSIQLAPQPKAAPPPPTVRRMTLANVRSTAHREPPRTLLYAVEGIGKSTFAAQAEAPIFIASEKGLAQIDAKAYPEPQSFAEVLEALDDLTVSDHTFKTVVIDTLDWVEPLLWAEVCRKNAWDNIEAPGYGKGYAAAVELWRLFLARLERLWEKRGMEVILLAHCHVKPFQNPSGPDYNRYTAAIHEKGYGLIKQWVSCVLFGQHEETTTDPKKGKVKGISTGRRVLYTERTAAWDAKNRYGLPPTLALDYGEYRRAVEAGLQADPDELMRACVALVEKLPADPKITEFLTQHANNAPKLAQALNRLRTRAASAGVEV